MKIVSALLVLLLAAPLWASAGDGVVEIHQACVAGGCFPGDAPNFPVEIDGSAGRSYWLSSNLRVPDENTTAILVRSDDISIDMSGFAILGVTSCSGSPTSCAPLGSGEGIAVENSAATKIHSGTIAKMGSNGAALGAGSLVQKMRFIFNGNAGARVGTGSMIRDSVAHRNGGIGLLGGSGSTIASNAVTGNGSTGIGGGDGLNVLGNASSDNRSGIFVNEAATIIGNAVSDNRTVGIFTDQEATIIGNTVLDNGSGGASDAGIECGRGCTVRVNAVRSNSIYGLKLSPKSAYSHNVFTSNGINVSSGFNRGENYCAPGPNFCPSN